MKTKIKTVFSLILAILLISFCSLPVQSQILAENFIYPTDNWQVIFGGGEFGAIRGENIYHLGIDAAANAGDNVYATAAGIVKHIGIHSRFGTVVLIEHTLKNKEKIVSLYGHLRNWDIEVSENQSVSRGQLIGHIGASGAENGFWSEHLHFAIRKGAYVSVKQGWVYWGLGDKNELKNWADPELFLKKGASQKIDPDKKGKILTVPGPGGRTRVKFFDKHGGQIENSDIYASAYDFYGGGDVAFGNVNGDQTKEIIVGSGRKSAPYVKIYDKHTKKLIRKFLAYDENFMGGVRVAAGDLDGDGKDEIITGAGPGGGAHVRVFTSSGKVIYPKLFPFGHYLVTGVDVAAGDIDGDKKDEIIVSLGPGKSPEVRVIQENGRLSKTHFLAYDKNFKGGVRIATGDIDKDGRDEIITGAGPGGGPHVRVFEGNGIPRATDFFPFHPNFRGGVDVATIDYDEDGKDEIVMAQSSEGQAWIKVYRFNLQRTILTNFLAYCDCFEGGANVAGLK